MLLIPITKSPQFYASQVIKHLEISTVFHDQGPILKPVPIINQLTGPVSCLRLHLRSRFR